MALLNSSLLPGTLLSKQDTAAEKTRQPLDSGVLRLQYQPEILAIFDFKAIILKFQQQV